jgi:hypothetical protein
MVGIPHGCEDVGSTGSYIHSNRAGLTIDDVRHGRNGQDMASRGNGMIISPALNNVRHRPTIDLEIGGDIPAEVRDSDDHEPPAWAGSSTACRDCRKNDKNQKTSGDAARSGPHELVVTSPASPLHALNAPERAMRAELRDFPGATSADVNGDRNYANERAHEYHRYNPRWDMPDV